MGKSLREFRERFQSGGGKEEANALSGGRGRIYTVAAERFKWWRSLIINDRTCE